MTVAAIAIVDLGLGNLRSVCKAIERAGGSPTLVRDPEVVSRAERVVVPGQGGFADAVRALAGGLGEALESVIRAGRPYLGICLGMQLLFEESEEAPGAAGLGHFPGVVRRFPPTLRDAETGDRLKVPHMGWNLVHSAHPLLPGDGWFYFVHSYHCVPADPARVAATADYGGPFCAAVAGENVFACQFHPEKSHRGGQAVLERFLATP